MLTSLMLLSFLNTSDAVPLQLTQQGRVLDNNGSAVSGAHDLTFRIFDSASNGSVYWSETLTVNFSNGYYAAILGTDEQNNPLDSSTLSLHPLYLEVQLDNNAPMTTRYEITSAPFAQMSGNAEVAESVDGGTVNATEVSINSNQVIDSNGNWVGQPITVDWNNIDPNTIPSYIADGDDNTQLSEGQVEGYITNDIINFASGSQVGGSDIVTVGTFASNLPSDLADGDDDTLAGLGCSAGELAGYDGAGWTCVSDNTLSVSDVTTMLANNAVDLNIATTIGGLDIVTSIDDSDTLAGLSCANDGDIARYDLVLDEWYCDALSGSGGGFTSPATLGQSDGGDSFASQDTPMSIPDNNSVGITSVRYVADSLTVDTLSLDLQMTHGDLGEVTVTLTSPLGTSLVIYDGGNPGETSFNQNIGWEVEFNTGNLYSFNGENIQGTWMLNVVDATNGNTGTLDSWTLRFNESWDGQMFVGQQVVVQDELVVRGEVRIEYGGSLVMTNTDGDETVRVEADEISGMTPSGGIIMWAGSTSDVPTGWALCDGTNGTPNLLDRFVVPAGGTYAAGQTGNGSVNITATNQTFGYGGSGYNQTFVKSVAGSDPVPKYYALAFIMKL